MSLEKRIEAFSRGAGQKNIMLMIWIFVLAGAFAKSAKDMGCIDATVNLTLYILPANMLTSAVTIPKPAAWCRTTSGGSISFT